MIRPILFSEQDAIALIVTSGITYADLRTLGEGKSEEVISP